MASCGVMATPASPWPSRLCIGLRISRVMGLRPSSCGQYRPTAGPVSYWRSSAMAEPTEREKPALLLAQAERCDERLVSRRVRPAEVAEEPSALPDEHH